MTQATEIASAGSDAAAPGGGSARRGQLAIAVQEVLTATVRLRANRQVATDATAFRQHVKQVMAAANEEAKRAGYSDEEIRLALYAVVAFLDESVLNSPLPVFADWPRKPLQDEIFGGHLGGEVFFQNLQHLLARPDSEDLADVLEVYQLCLLLGFHGRYSRADGGERQMIIMRVAEKMRRIRGPFGELSPAWTPPAGEIRGAGVDRWPPRLTVGLIGTLVVAALLFVVFQFSLRSGIATLHAVASQIVR